jgi:hypothetical protein
MPTTSVRRLISPKVLILPVYWDFAAFQRAFGGESGIQTHGTGQASSWHSRTEFELGANGLQKPETDNVGICVGSEVKTSIKTQ